MDCLWDAVAPGDASPGDASPAGAFHGQSARVEFAELATGSTLPGLLEELRGLSVVIATEDQLATALALIELDGVARRIVLCTPDLTPEQRDAVAASAAADAIVTDRDQNGVTKSSLPYYVMQRRPLPGKVERGARERTEWVLLTSGTTGAPKLVEHSLASLAGALPRKAPDGRRIVWSTFYDIRRYGGLQIYLRAVVSRSTLVLSSAAEATADFLSRAAAAGVTHISGTPSHWRRTLMSGTAQRLNPAYVRLSGEVADQAVLDGLRAAYPRARIAHAFASTEAGVGFDVTDGLAGFPAVLIEETRRDAQAPVSLEVMDGTLRIRSNRIAARYLSDTAQASIAGADGFVDTGDLVELVDGRYYFRGRRGGVINVGGLKVYPEEVESCLNADPRVRMSLVRARRNPITGAVVVADVVLVDEVGRSGDPTEADRLKSDLLNLCRRSLPAHKVPATLRFVPSLELSAAGKLVRTHA